MELTGGWVGAGMVTISKIVTISFFPPCIHMTLHHGEVQSTPLNLGGPVTALTNKEWQ